MSGIVQEALRRAYALPVESWRPETRQALEVALGREMAERAGAKMGRARRQTVAMAMPCEKTRQVERSGPPVDEQQQEAHDAPIDNQTVGRMRRETAAKELAAGPRRLGDFIAKVRPPIARNAMRMWLAEMLNDGLVEYATADGKVRRVVDRVIIATPKLFEIYGEAAE